MRLTMLLLLALNLTACAAPAKYVLLVSIDGMRPDAMMKARMPHLKKLIARGAHSLTARTVMPSITLTSHVSMVTGVGPERHQVLWNEYRPEKGPVKSRTMFDVAKDAGLSTALFAGKPKFRHFDLGKRLDVCEVPEYAATQVAARAADYIVEHRPRLVMVHFADPDGAGHSQGWMSPFYMDALESADDALGVVLRALVDAGIDGETAVIVTTDHGGHAKTHGTASREDMTIPWIAAGAGVKPVAKPLDAPIGTVDTAATAVALLGLAVPRDWEGKAVRAALEEPAAPASPAPVSAASGRVQQPAAPR